MPVTDTLKNPILEANIQQDFSSFPGDRRWDLLGFVKGEEVEEIKSCEVGSDGNRYYLLQWKLSWKAESSLVYCEKLLQDFWAKKSLVQDNSMCLSSYSKCYEKDAIFLEDKLILTSTKDIEAQKNDPLMKEIPFAAELIGNEKNGDTVAPAEEAVINANTFEIESTNQMQPDEQLNSYTSVPSNPAVNLDKEISSQAVTLQNTSSLNLNSSFSFDNDDNQFDKKGANKRKVRPPRQSMRSLSVSATKKEKIKLAKEKVKKAKTTRTKVSKVYKSLRLTKVDSVTQSGLSLDRALSCKSQKINQRKVKIKKSPEDAQHQGELQETANNLKCMVCDKCLSTEQNLMKHLLTHNNNHTCNVCLKTFKSTHFLKHHMDKHNSSYQYPCPMCNKLFKFKNNMRGHLRKHNMEKKFECEICHKKFIGRYNLKEHMKAHSSVRPYECDFCKKAYKDRGALNKHLLTHQDKKVECVVCRRQFTNQAQVVRHMQFHYSWPGDSFKRKTYIGPDGEKLKYKCEHCDKTFNHYSNMNSHMHKKHKEKKIQCADCPKQFAYQYELREHMFMHTKGEISKFKCQFCEKSFQRSTTLKNHERTTHLGIKRFKCEVCGKGFGTKFNMKVHIDKVHNYFDEKTQVLSRDQDTVQSLNSVLPQESISVHENLQTLQVPLSNNQSVWRHINASDLMRNAMSHIPEFGYFSPMHPSSSRGYQFYSSQQL